MPFDSPIQLGPFSVGPDGSLALATPDSLPRFEVDWRGCRVEVALRVAGHDSRLGEVSLKAVIGRIPSTVRGGRPAILPRAVLARGERGGATARRGAVFEVLRSLPGALPAGWRTDLLADHRVSVIRAGTMTMPTTVDSLLTDVTLFLLALGPYLDLMAEAGLEAPGGSAPGGAPGTVNTWPG